MEKSRTVKDRSLEDIELAKHSGDFFDLPPRIKSILLIIGVLGFIFVVMQSVVGGSERTIGIDKVIHFSGYTLMALVFTLALKPKSIAVLLIIIAAISICIEFIQIPQGRTFEFADMFANVSGIFTGLVAGFLGRIGYNLAHRQIILNRIKRHIQTFKKDQLILQEGHPVQNFFIIKSGKVGLRHPDLSSNEYAFVLGSGEVFGVTSAILNIPQEYNVYALEASQIYEMSIEELMDSTGSALHPAALILQRSAEQLIVLNRKVEGLERQLKDRRN